jgi:hypothetical protein
MYANFKRMLSLLGLCTKPLIKEWEAKMRFIKRSGGLVKAVLTDPLTPKLVWVQRDSVFFSQL